SSSSSLSQSQKDGLQKTLDEFTSNMSSMPFTAALDDQGRLRKLTNTMDISILGFTEQIDTTISYSNFGVALNVEPPPGFANGTPTTDATEPPVAPGDRAVQSDLRNGLTAEKVQYTDQQEYSSNVDDMATIEGSLDWGGSLHVGVSSDKQSV